MPCRRSSLAFTLVELLVILAILGVVLALILAGVQHAREAASRITCINNLRQIGLALHQYHDAQERFPPGVSNQGESDSYRFMSWQTRLLPYLEQQALWEDTRRAYAEVRRFDVNPPHFGLGLVMPVFNCPSDPRAFTVGQTFYGIRAAFSNYLGVEGINQTRKDGLLFLNSRTCFADVTDGTSYTVAVGERPPSPDGWWGWWYGGWGQRGDGAADMVLGVKEKNYSLWPDTRNCLVGPYEYGPGNAKNMCDVFHFWSHHPGGANFLFVDGSVHFLPYGARPMMRALATIAGGEAVSPPN